MTGTPIGDLFASTFGGVTIGIGALVAAAIIHKPTRERLRRGGGT